MFERGVIEFHKAVTGIIWGFIGWFYVLRVLNFSAYEGPFNNPKRFFFKRYWSLSVDQVQGSGDAKQVRSGSVLIFADGLLLGAFKHNADAST